MPGSLVVLTGASGVGKTTVAHLLQRKDSHRFSVFFFDSIGLPAADEMRSYGDGHQPGGAWQRAMTLRWIERIPPILQTGKSVLIEGQMRIAFIQEALELFRIPRARIVLLDCDDAVRDARLVQERRQPELANDAMANWSRYLREEALRCGCEILDTAKLTAAVCAERLQQYLLSGPED